MRIAPIPPSHCSVCFNQDPDALHVDMEAATDGPVLETADGIKVSIDDIIICETCLRRAQDLLPEYLVLRQQVIEAQAETRRALEYATSLKASLDQLRRLDAMTPPAEPTPPPRRPRRPVAS